MKNILYLHVSWSKTGTSAIQKKLHTHYDLLLQRNLLYPQNLQWNDHAHHDFALAFKKNIPDNAVYKSKYTPSQALETLLKEMNATHAENVLISSELSPFYFQNADFKAFISSHFTKVILIFTIRRQSELLMSMYNQLIKDPNVRFPHSLFCLFTRQIKYLNFYQQIHQWLKFVKKENVIVIPYGPDIVDQFVASIGISPGELKSLEKNERNVSLPHRILLQLQAKQPKLTNTEYLDLTEKLSQASHEIEKKYDSVMLFSDTEQQSIDKFYAGDNLALAKKFGLDIDIFGTKKYQDILALPADFDFIQ